jgi:hypothetical protein
MWPFASAKPVVVPLSEPIQLSLSKDRGISPDVAVALRMVEERGNYAGRQVTYFRVFDPGNTKWGTSEVRRFDELDARRILHSGHVERDGVIVLNRDSGQT